MEVAVQGTQLNNIGILFDFQDLKTAVQVLIDQIDHRYLNEIPPFDKISPTAENIAMWAYQHLQKMINNDQIKITTVTVWESENSGVCYTEED